MKIREALLAKSAELAEQGIQSAKLEAEVLIRHALRIDRAEFFASLDQELPGDQIERIDTLISRRLEHEPLAYIVGHREFYGLDFNVNAHVLIPRQETELLVEKSLSFASERSGEHLHIADIGIGSGAIAISVASNLPEVTVYATDISPEALSIAKSNALKHGVSNRVNFIRGDLFEGIPAKVDLIVSNPPYLRSGDIPNLDPEVRGEPVSALDGGEDGLDVIRQLINQAPSHIKPKGLILIEMNPDQIEAARYLAQEAFPNARITVHKDMLGLPRVLEARLSNKSP